MKKLTLTSTIALFVFANALSICSGESEVNPAAWCWIKVGNNADHHWDVSSGPADVSIEKQQFVAKLFWRDAPDRIQIELIGSINGNKLKVKERVNASGYTGAILSGTYNKASDVETINLSDGFGMIGITRAVQH
jgi:hypothetical protein